MNINTKRSVFCVACNTVATRWGKDRSGHVRYRCSFCKKTFISYQRHTGMKHSLLWCFEQYILYGVTCGVLSTWSGYSTRQLHRRFSSFLATDPPLLILPLEKTQKPTLSWTDGGLGKKSVLCSTDNPNQAYSLCILHEARVWIPDFQKSENHS